jgi:hypothetical protein
MPRPFFRVELRLLPTEKGGRSRPVFDDYRPNWNLGNKWLGEPTVNDGRVFLEGSTELPPGAEGLARIEPLVPELWGGVRPGSTIPMQEGSRVVGYARVLEIISCPAYWTPEVAAFVDQAWQFCDFIEKAVDTRWTGDSRARVNGCSSCTRPVRRCRTSNRPRASRLVRVPNRRMGGSDSTSSRSTGRSSIRTRRARRSLGLSPMICWMCTETCVAVSLSGTRTSPGPRRSGSGASTSTITGATMPSTCFVPCIVHAAACDRSRAIHAWSGEQPLAVRSVSTR